LLDGPRGGAAATELIEIRRRVSDRLGEFATLIPVDSRVYDIWTGSTGLPFFISAFELKPRYTNPINDARCHSLGPRRFDGDIWSCDWSPAKFREVLRAYDFVFLGEADDLFWARYQSLFTVDSRASGSAFYRIDNSAADGLLSPVRSQP
jgi:hypothetical protein